jgi:RNA polymerase sigma factor (sigma-70 family)
MAQRRRMEQPLEEEGEGSDERGVRPELVSPLPTPEQALAGWNRQSALHAAIARLNERCRKLILLIFLDTREPSYDEISDMLNMPKGSIGPSRNRCLQHLRSHLEHEDVADDD